uniref:Uncharacterized protein n=1 Tax=Parascaris univalens TaxID=6257 RepID=A0A915B6K6_PARUN
QVDLMLIMDPFKVSSSIKRRPVVNSSNEYLWSFLTSDEAVNILRQLETEHDVKFHNEGSFVTVEGADNERSEIISRQLYKAWAMRDFKWSCKIIENTEASDCQMFFHLSPAAVDIIKANTDMLLGDSNLIDFMIDHRGVLCAFIKGDSFDCISKRFMSLLKHRLPNVEFRNQGPYQLTLWLPESFAKRFVEGNGGQYMELIRQCTITLGSTKKPSNNFVAVNILAKNIADVMKARDALMKWMYEDAEGKHQYDGSSAAIYSNCCGECRSPLGIDANLPPIADVKDIEETSHFQYGVDGQLMSVLSDVCRQTDLPQTTGQGIRPNIVSSCADRTELSIYKEWPVTMLGLNAINSGLEPVQVDGAVKQNHMMEYHSAPCTPQKVVSSSFQPSLSSSIDSYKKRWDAKGYFKRDGTSSRYKDNCRRKPVKCLPLISAQKIPPDNVQNSDADDTHQYK